MKLSVSDGKSQAYLHPELGEPGTKIPVASLRSFLSENGISDTVLAESLEKIESEGLPNDDVLVAVGVPPQKGMDGWVEHLFKAKRTPPDLEKDPHACLLEIYNVTAGEVLARLHPPEPGIPGKTVFGIAITPQPGKPARLRIGENAKLTEDGAACAATVDGGANLALDGSIAVDPVLRIKGDVGPMTGNIDFIGSVFVHGDVKSEFRVKAGRNLTVNGSVGDAHIEVGQDAIITEGFLGTGKGSLRAGGVVKLKIVHFQEVFAGNEIQLERESIAARLHAEHRIVGPRAVIVGGMLEAADEIVVMDLGNGEETNVTAHVGSRPKLLERLGELDRRHQQLEKQLKDVKEGAYKLIRIQLDAGHLTPEQDALLERLKKVHDDLPRELAANEQEQKNLRDLMQSSLAAKITVRGTVTTNALIDVNGVKKMIQQPLREVLFIEKSGRIEQMAP